MRTETDVVVIGFGAAGAAAAIAAHDAGAEVVIVEKSAAAGGNCRYSGAFVLDIDGPCAVEHLDAVCFGKTDRPVLEAYAEGLHEVIPWIESLGGTIAPCDIDAFGGMLPCWPNFPGAGHVHYSQFVPNDEKKPGKALWALLDGGVRSRGIEVHLDTPVRELLIEDGAVRGVVVATGDDPERHTIRARRGVILASGSFEYDADMRDAFLPLPLAAVGHPGNTGDTIRLAQQAGASLWHMSAFFGWFAFATPEYPAAFTLDVHAPSFVFVDGDGRRFADETGWEAHDRVRSLTAYLPRRHNRPRMPGFIIFDEAARLAGPLHGIVGSPNEYAWSADNSAEIERGWIVRGENAGQLATAIGVDPSVLQSTLAEYAGAVSERRDDLFGRSRRTLAPLLPPLYAIELTPAVATASGGPRRDALARVVSADRDPIPGLYAAGAAGSIWGHLTEHGGGLTDAIVFGRIAGASAARSQ